MELFELTVRQASTLIRQREISPVELVDALLRRIDALDSAIEAWETIDRDGALASARRLEHRAREGNVGLLHGVPVGIKDVIHTAGLPTRCGSSIFHDFVPGYDATAVARLRDAGAIVLGKTVTAQFAQFDPPRTRNPWNVSRSPGGSSSGSGAAVAARMVPAALGTQTGGSTLRPAAYCGIVGLKPTYGLVSRYGVIPASWTMDHLGILTRTVEDAALLLQAIAGPDPLDPVTSRVPVTDYLAAAHREIARPRIGLLTDYFARSHSEVTARLTDVADRLSRAGADLHEMSLPPPPAAIRTIIMRVESSAVHARLLQDHPEGYESKLRARVEVGQLIPGVAYIQAQRLRGRLRAEATNAMRGIDCLLMPTTPNTAPDLSTTGDSSFQASWSLFGFPAINLPVGLSSDGLPIGAQLVSGSFREEALLGVAAWCEQVLGSVPSPALTGANG